MPLRVLSNLEYVVDLLRSLHDGSIETVDAEWISAEIM